MDKPIRLHGDDPAPEGYVFVCAACGKISPSLYGYNREGHYIGPPLWDESCVMNAFLCKETQLIRNERGRVTEIKGEPVDFETIYDDINEENSNGD